MPTVRFQKSVPFGHHFGRKKEGLSWYHHTFQKQKTFEMFDKKNIILLFSVLPAGSGWRHAQLHTLKPTNFMMGWQHHGEKYQN